MPTFDPNQLTEVEKNFLKKAKNKGATADQAFQFLQQRGSAAIVETPQEILSDPTATPAQKFAQPDEQKIAKIDEMLKDTTLSPTDRRGLEGVKRGIQEGTATKIKEPVSIGERVGKAGEFATETAKSAAGAISAGAETITEPITDFTITLPNLEKQFAKESADFRKLQSFLIQSDAPEENQAPAREQLEEIRGRMMDLNTQIGDITGRSTVNRLTRVGAGTVGVAGGTAGLVFGTPLSGAFGLISPEVEAGVEKVGAAAKEKLISDFEKTGLTKEEAKVKADERITSIFQGVSGALKAADEELVGLLGESGAKALKGGVKGAAEAAGGKALLKTGEQVVKAVAPVVKEAAIAGAEKVGAVAAKVSAKFKPITPAETAIQQSGKIRIGKLEIPTSETTLTGGILQRMHRPNPVKAQNFASEAGESIGEFLTKRGIVGSPETTIGKLFERFIKSKSQADKGFEAIGGKFKDKTLTKVANKLLEQERAIAQKGAATRDKKLIENLVKKLEGDGLSMSEINTLKRLYERKVKTEFMKDRTKSSLDIQAATELDDALRKWQRSIAEEGGFTDLIDINRETRLTRQALEAIGEKFLRVQSNNAVSLTDWIVASQVPTNPAAVALLLGKKLSGSDLFQTALAKLLGIGKKTVGEPDIRSLSSIERRTRINEFRESLKGDTKTQQLRGQDRKGKGKSKSSDDSIQISDKEINDLIDQPIGERRTPKFSAGEETGVARATSGKESPLAKGKTLNKIEDIENGFVRRMAKKIKDRGLSINQLKEGQGIKDISISEIKEFLVKENISIDEFFKIVSIKPRREINIVHPNGDSIGIISNPNIKEIDGFEVMLLSPAKRKSQLGQVGGKEFGVFIKNEDGKFVQMIGAGKKEPTLDQLKDKVSSFLDDPPIGSGSFKSPL